jgi:hypothetical protein
MAKSPGAMPAWEQPRWTIDTYAAHNEAMRLADRELIAERDRRYAEVNVEKEKALKIKETADLAALELARESQTYKEQQNDVIRDKSLADSGVYATNASVAAAIGSLRTDFQPLFDFVAGQKGATGKGERISGRIWAFAGILATLGGALVVLIINLLP